MGYVRRPLSSVKKALDHNSRPTRPQSKPIQIYLLYRPHIRAILARSAPSPSSSAPSARPFWGALDTAEQTRQACRKCKIAVPFSPKPATARRAPSGLSSAMVAATGFGRRAGTVEFRIPKLRKGSNLPTFLEPRPCVVGFETQGSHGLRIVHRAVDKRKPAAH